MHENSSFVMADIPGLIEGAGEGVGLGHQFLRHVERCRLLVHIVDVSGSEGRNPIEDFETINKELVKFNKELAERPMIVAGNKCDLATNEQIEAFRIYVEGKGYEFFPIMAAIRYNVDPLLNKIEDLLSKLPSIKIYEAEPKLELFDNPNEDVKVEIKNGTYFVTGPHLELLVKSINFDDYESLQYFQKSLASMGVIDALHNAGVEEGASINIYDFEFDFVE